MDAHFKCWKCKHEWWQDPRPPPECPRCSHLYLTWVNYEEWRADERRRNRRDHESPGDGTCPARDGGVCEEDCPVRTTESYVQDRIRDALAEDQAKRGHSRRKDVRRGPGGIRPGTRRPMVTNLEDALKEVRGVVDRLSFNGKEGELRLDDEDPLAFTLADDAGNAVSRAVDILERFSRLPSPPWTDTQHSEAWRILDDIVSLRLGNDDDLDLKLSDLEDRDDPPVEKREAKKQDPKARRVVLNDASDHYDGLFQSRCSMYRDRGRLCLAHQRMHENLMRDASAAVDEMSPATVSMLAEALTLRPRPRL